MIKKIAIVGAGITGSVIARCAADIGINVDIFEKRNHLAGNCYDIEEFNSFTHKYGPHLFHTGNKKVVDRVKTNLLLQSQYLLLINALINLNPYQQIRNQVNLLILTFSNLDLTFFHP